MPVEQAADATSSPTTPARRLNVRRGLFRTWLLFSGLWFVIWGALAAPDWYVACSYWFHTRGFEVVPALLRPGSSDAEVCWDRSKSRACYDVTSPKGCKYFVIADRRVYTAATQVAAYIVDEQKCNHPTTSGFGNDPVRIDLSSSDPQWTVVSRSAVEFGPYPDLSNAKIFTALAFAVPTALLALGVGIGWIAMGFKP